MTKLKQLKTDLHIFDIEDFKVGDRIKLVYMGNDPNPIKEGDIGEITRITKWDDFFQISMIWDSGRNLSVLIPPDIIIKL